MKQLKVAVVGCGNRGQAYAGYTFLRPEEVEIKCVVDVDKHALEYAKKQYNVKDGFAFSSIEDFIDAKVECDFVINATMDSIHYKTAIQLLNAGYNLLLEKPVTANPKEFLDIVRISKEKNLKVFVCHVLRYAPFYRAIKDVLEAGTIGNIVSIESNEHVGFAHYIESYVRGPWKSETECGSTFLLAKCCHDLDLICWLNGATKPKQISSFGSRSHFILDQRPEGATDNCFTCPHSKTCLFDSEKLHLEYQPMPFQTYKELISKLDKDAEDIPDDVKMEYLKTSEFGKCVYLGKDLVDRQSVDIQFENGSIASFCMIGGVARADRYINIVGTKGEIEGKISDKKFTIRTMDRSKGKYEYVNEEVDISNRIINNEKYGGHGGGDFAIMRDVVRFMAGEGATTSLTEIHDSIPGHFCVYEAEESRKTGKIVNYQEFIDNHK